MTSLYFLLWSATFVTAGLFLWVRWRNGRSLWPIYHRLTTSTFVKARTVYSREQLRNPVSALLLGGLLLLLMSQISYTDAGWQRRELLLLTGLGAGAFWLGGQTAVHQRPPKWIIRPTRWLCTYFRISSVQLILLFMAPCFGMLTSFAAGEEPQLRHPFIAISSWLASIICIVWGCWENGTSWQLGITRKEMWKTAVLFALALALRASIMDQIPTTLSGDESAAGLLAIQFLQGKFNNLFIDGWYSFPSMYFAWQSTGIALWGQTAQGLRLTSAIGGAVAVLATYWLAYSMFDQLTARLAALYLAISHYHIHFSRIGLNNIWDSLWGTLAVLGLWHSWQTGRRTSVILCGLALGLGQYFYVTIRVVPILFLIWVSIAALWKPARFKQRLPDLSLAAYSAFIMALPLTLFFARHLDNFMAPFQRVSISGDWLINADVGNALTTTLIFRQMRLASLAFIRAPLRGFYEAGVPLLLTIAASLFLLGLLWAVTHFDLRYLLLILPLLAVIIINGFSLYVPAAQRYIIAMPMTAIILALPISFVASWLRHLWASYHTFIIVGVTAVMLYLLLTDLHFYFFRAYDTFILGGNNTETATRIGYYLDEQPVPVQTVYFFGFPRMGYFSIPTISYLAPQAVGIDIFPESVGESASWKAGGKKIFIFLPERLGELNSIQPLFPNGHYQEFYSLQGTMLFAAYELLED